MSDICMVLTGCMYFFGLYTGYRYWKIKNDDFENLIALICEWKNLAEDMEIQGRAGDTYRDSKSIVEKYCDDNE